MVYLFPHHDEERFKQSKWKGGALGFSYSPIHFGVYCSEISSKLRMSRSGKFPILEIDSKESVTASLETTYTPAFRFAMLGLCKHDSQYSPI